MSRQHPLAPENRVPLTHELRDHLKALAKARGLTRHADAWLAEATLCVRLDLEDETDPEELGASRYGGEPDLPRGVAWPSGRDGAFVFLQQVNLGEVPTLPGKPLPASGLLSLFLEDDEQSGGGGGAFHLLYHDVPPRDLVRVESPTPMVPALENYSDLRSFRLQPRVAVSLPMYGGEYEKLSESLGEKWRTLFDLESRAFGAEGRDAVGGRLLGHPYGVQSDHVTHAILIHHGKKELVDAYYKTEDAVRQDLAAATASGDARVVAHLQRIVSSHRWLKDGLLERERDLWLPLWQVESNFKVGACFWDAGALATYVLRADLARSDFSRVYTELESS